jgi:hypothetical protein
MEEAKPKYEKDRVNTRAIFKFILILLVVAAVVHVLMGLLFVELDKAAKARDPQLSPVQPRTTQAPPEPKLQISPRTDLQQLVQVETETLNSYGWVDEKSGIVRIPINEAMKLLIGRKKNTPAQSPHEEPQSQTNTAGRDARPPNSL